MMKAAAILAVALALPACATNSDSFVEQGYERGSLAVASLHREDWKTAEKQLMAHRGVPADDPALLINLGQLYMETGRTDEALTAWRTALNADRHFLVETTDGRVASTKKLAEQALALHSD